MTTEPLTLAQAEALVAAITDAQLDGNVHGQTTDQRARLARAKALAWQHRTHLAEQQAAPVPADPGAEPLAAARACLAGLFLSDGQLAARTLRIARALSDAEETGYQRGWDARDRTDCDHESTETMLRDDRFTETCNDCGKVVTTGTAQNYGLTPRVVARVGETSLPGGGYAGHGASEGDPAL